MKCPLCGAWSQVLATRGIKRRRECANHHRFSTLELRDTAQAREELKRYQTTIKTATRIWARNQRIIADQRSSLVIGLEYGLAAPTVRKIKRLGASPRNSKEK